MIIKQVWQSDKFATSWQRVRVLFTALFLYLLLGAFVFQYIEYEARDELVEDALDEIESERHSVLEVRDFIAYNFL
jgi:hypothetical protein